MSAAPLTSAIRGGAPAGAAARDRQSGNATRATTTGTRSSRGLTAVPRAGFGARGDPTPLGLGGRGSHALRLSAKGAADGEQEQNQTLRSNDSEDIRANINEAGKRLRRTLADHGSAVVAGNAAGWPWGSGETARVRAVTDEEASWAAWERTFASVDEEEKHLTGLRAQLENALINENYDDATQVKRSIDGIKAKDVVGGVLQDMELALEEERYSDAARMRDEGYVGLLGWWAGRGETKAGAAAEPFGHVVKISGQHGRYVAQAYTARDLADLQEIGDAASGLSGVSSDPADLPGNGYSLGALGIPVMELFLRDDGDGRYASQACAFRGEPMDAGSLSSMVGQLGGLGLGHQAMDMVDWGMETPVGGAAPAAAAAAAEVVAVPEVDAMAAEEGMLGDMDLDAMMPFEVNAGELMQLKRVPADLITLGRSEFVLDLREDEDADEASAFLSFDEAVEEEEEGGGAAVEGRGAVDVAVDEGRSGGDIAGDIAGGIDGGEIGGGGALESAEEKWARVAQEVARLEAGSVTSKRRLAQALKDAAEHMLEGSPSPAPTAAGAPIPAPPLDGPLGQEVEPMYTTLRQNRTRFVKLDVDAPATDPFTGLYLGVFGPHGPEVLQLRRGAWEGADLDGDASADEYVQATKVTGDANVPVGVASFRAKVGPRHRLEHRGIYPEELCVVGRYMGEGRVAQAGFKDARWVEGELLQFGTSGAALTGGAELGFVWAVPGERRFLLLFKRLDLSTA